MEFRKKTIADVDLIAKTVLMRVDYNVPMKDGVISDTARIDASLKSINYLLNNGVEKLVLISHLGRPKGQKVPEFSLAPVAACLAEKMSASGHVVEFVEETTGPKVQAALANLASGGILLLENLRFSELETANSEEFADEIIAATGADLFVQDGFAVIHRAHTSTDALARKLPAVAGFLVQHEVESLEKAVKDPAHPVLVIMGGAKVEDKQPMIDQFLPIADHIAVGGKIASSGYQASDAKIYVAEDFREDAEGNRLDVGDLSAAKICEMIAGAKTVVWNGTLGMVEDPAYAKSSLMVADAMGKLAVNDTEALTVVGGGDTAGFVNGQLASHPEWKYSLISTGGGASLALLSGEKLPGLEVLQDK